MKNSILSLAVTIFALGISQSMAADSAATVTEAVNQVVHGSSQATDTAPATPGTRLQDGEYLKTGVKSRAELELANQTITRLGANTIFNYSLANNEVDLQAGTILFSKPKDGQQMNIKTASVAAAIVGTTGFVSVHGHQVLFGLIEGHAVLTIGGIRYHVGAGETLQFNNGTPPQIHSFNVPLLLKTSPLITNFKPLPNQPYIDREVAEYNNLASRGYIESGSGPTVYGLLNNLNSGTPIKPPAFDSAGNAHSQANTPPPPAFVMSGSSF